MMPVTCSGEPISSFSVNSKISRSTGMATACAVRMVNWIQAIGE